MIHEISNILELWPEAFASIQASLRLARDQERAMESAGRGGAAIERSLYDLRGDVAVINVSGPLSKGENFMTAYCGWSSYSRTMQALSTAAGDDKVGAMLMVIDSPGGAAMGGSDMADAIVAARSSGKKVGAYIRDIGASAAYRMASQCDHISANRGALVGSIGTYMVMYDLSRMFENEGIKAIVIRDGDFKGAGSVGTAITDEQKAEFEREVSSLSATFRDDVARGRRMSAAKVRELADGRVHIAKDAIALGLIDEVCDLGSAIARLQGAGERKQDNGVRRNGYA